MGGEQLQAAEAGPARDPTWDPARVRAAYAACLRIAQAHYENFPVASLLLPRAQRRHVAAIYAFARQADDFADEPAYAGRRLELLADWRARLERARRGEANEDIFIAVAESLRTQQLPVGLLHDLLSAFEQDVRVSSYETFTDVLAYCRLSANPIGRLVLHLFGRAQEPLLAASDAICTALQLANFWQDVAIDLDKGRCYLPREDQRRFGCDEAAIRSRSVSPAYASLMRFQVQRTRDLFAQGAELPRMVGGRLGFELRLVMLGGLGILDRIERVGFDVFTRRPSLSRADWGRLVLRAAVS